MRGPHDDHHRPPALDDLARRTRSSSSSTAASPRADDRRVALVEPGLPRDPRARPRRRRQPSIGASRRPRDGSSRTRRTSEPSRRARAPEARDREGPPAWHLRPVGSPPEVDDWSWARRAARRRLARLARPYRGRVALGLVAVLVATAAGLAPPVPRPSSRSTTASAAATSTPLTWIVAAFVGAGVVGWLAGRRADVPRGLGRRARARRPARAPLPRTCSGSRSATTSATAPAR